MEYFVGKIGWINRTKVDRTLPLETLEKPHQCIRSLGDKLMIDVDGDEIEVPLNAFYTVSSELKFKPYEKVKYLSSKGKLGYGVIVEIHFHINKNEYFYFLEVNGVMKTRRYFEEDLQKIEE
ncbi:hypothetical protein GCM10022393_43570 [Aquimarina addita]|uniref:Uncharacterized protein n=1 Tax=Aquimarina addita TaxID=870485 RepID=A0ABP6V0U2_9FLAO